MNREKLILQVKDIYSRLASDESKWQTTQSTSELTPEAYYEKILDMVVKEINLGTFDFFTSGKEIVNAVTKNKSKWLSNWEQIG